MYPVFKDEYTFKKGKIDDKDCSQSMYTIKIDN